jgi:methylmalonyl-CoA mutase N-terminal domain/subunit
MGNLLEVCNVTSADKLLMIEKERLKWEKECLSKNLKPVCTQSGIEANVLYTPLDLGSSDYLSDIGFPGQYPFTRGIYPSMYRGQAWTFRQYSGFGTAEESNARYKYLLQCGQNGLSVAFDLPTQLGYDSDEPLARAEVGRVGVAVDTLKDMEILFEGISLDKISTSFTINAPAAIILAMYIAVGEKQGVPAQLLTGTLQNDILKEYLARGTYIFPPRQSMRLIGDIMEYCAKHVPRFNTISITGYHVRESGADAVQEIAFALAQAVAYSEEAIKRGMDFDVFAPRFSFLFGAMLDFFEEIAKLRACRRVWARLCKDKFKAKDPRSCALKVASGCTGTTFTKKEPLNNIIRATLECLAVVLGGSQACHVMGYDEAYTLPSELSTRLGLRTQQIIAYESGVCNTVDPLGGSYYVEYLTNKLEEKIVLLMDEIESKGGIVELIEKGELQRQVLEQAYQDEKKVKSGEKVIIGVNKFIFEAEETNYEEEVELQETSPEIIERQIRRLQGIKEQRNQQQVQQSLNELEKAAIGTDNLVPYILQAVKSYATLGEIISVLKRIFGEYRAPEGL